MDQSRAPLFEALNRHHRQDPVSFHVPGHKSRSLFSPEADSFFEHIYKIDLTELSGLDDLHHPEGAIREAQELASACFGAEQSWFLVGGSTVGNLAMIHSLCAQGELLIVQRNAHKSVIHGLMLAGASAAFISPRIDEASGTACGVTADDVRAALQRYPEAKGVLLTNPSYYGYSTELRTICEQAHALGKVVLVDEAHGAHFGFHQALPESALQAGADAVVQSTHKMLPAMTMGAMMHVRGERIDRQRLQWYLSVLQSSSPSYPILASLDLARLAVAHSGNARLELALQAAADFQMQAAELPWLYTEVRTSSRAFESRDPLKLVLHDRTGTLSGFRLLEALRQYGCMAEMADLVNVLAVFGFHSDPRDAERLVQALAKISDHYELGRKELKPQVTNNITTNFHLSSNHHPLDFCRDGLKPYERSSIRLTWEQAKGRIAAETVIPYPPGIPVVLPGERVTAEVIEMIKLLAAEGAHFQGAGTNSHEGLRVEA